MTKGDDIKSFVGTNLDYDRIEKYKSQIITEYKIIDTIKNIVAMVGKETGSNKLYFLENGNVIYAKYSSLRQYDIPTYSFAVLIEKFEEYKEKNLVLILSCGSFERTLVIPDAEKLFKIINVSSRRRWQFHILEDMKLFADRTVDLTKYLNKWEFINRHSKTNMEDNIILAELRTKIFEYISKLSKENKKCNHNYLCINLYSDKYSKYDILYALKYLEEKEAIYKIPYVDWYIKENFRESELDDDNRLLIDTFVFIKNYSKKYNWKYGIKKSDLYDRLLERGYGESDIRDALKLLEERKIISKKTFIYWFTKDYKGNVLKGDFLESKDKDIIYMPEKTDKIEEKDIENYQPIIEPKIEMVEDIQQVKVGGDYKHEFDPSKIEFLIKKWKDLKVEQEKIRDDINKEIEKQKELEDKREESIKRQNLLETRIVDINKQKSLLESKFEPISVVYDQFNEEKKMKSSGQKYK